MVVGLLGNKSTYSNRFILVFPKPENGVRLQATLGSKNPTGLPMGVVNIEFDTYAENSDGKKIMKTGSMAVIFNINIINEEEVNKLIDSGKAEYDERVILVTQKQAKNLFYKKKEKGN